MKRNRVVLKNQWFNYVRIFLVFILLYLLLIGFSFVSNHFQIIDFKVEQVSYLFFIYLFVMAWLNLTKNITFFSYHSVTRKEILNQTMLIQFITCLAGSFVIEGINQLIARFPKLMFINYSDSIRSIYLKEFNLPIYAELIAVLLFLTLVLFCVSQLANLVAILTYSWKRTKLLGVLSLVFAVLVLLIFSFRFWTGAMYSIFVKIMGWLTGTGQNVVPSLVIPLTLIILILIVVVAIETKKMKRLEINKFIV
ncbi:hypothetical protein [Vagococcus sp.]|uniref:hypothetical protein n=1 Tax=Vagococcus sp. TaxID=1933889 RepID=UPI003F986A0F